MSKFLKYQKRNIGAKLDCVNTSVSIEKRQKIFLEQYGINLSELTRDRIDEVMDDFVREASKREKSRK